MPHYIRSPQRHVKRQRSIKQVKRNKAFLTCCNYWKQNSTLSVRDSWDSFSTYPEIGLNAFLRINIIRVYNDLPIDPTPPGVV